MANKMKVMMTTIESYGPPWELKVGAPELGFIAW